MMTKVSKDLEEEENIVGQAKSGIKEIDGKITEAQNPSTRLPNIAHTTFAIAARSTTTAVQTLALQVSAV